MNNTEIPMTIKKKINNSKKNDDIKKSLNRALINCAFLVPCKNWCHKNEIESKFENNC